MDTLCMGMGRGSVGRSFQRAVSQGMAVSRARAVFRDSAKLPGRGFTGTALGGGMAQLTWTDTMAAE
jgi:hypothetical protein